MLLETEAGDKLVLWDTPGFGDSARLLQRLKRSGQRMQWFLTQAWDRVGDRAMWCSQQAARNVQDDADVVLYLVNASEDPGSAGYINVEMEILAWIGKPVIVLLNQLGAPEESAKREREVLAWQQELNDHGIVKRVLSLDAFTRNWVDEQKMVDAVAEVLKEKPSGGLAARVARAWRERNESIFRNSVSLVADQVIAALEDRRVLKKLKLLDRFKVFGKSELNLELKLARQAMIDGLHERSQRTRNELIRLQGLEGHASSNAFQIADEQFTVPEQVTESLWTIVGGAAAGAGGGLVADVASGGMTFFGGAVLGGIGGGAGAYFLARGFNLARGGNNSVRWSLAHLLEQWKSNLLAYLAVAHFGRGRGEWKEGPMPEHWVAAVEQQLESQREEIAEIWNHAREVPLADPLKTKVTAITEAILRECLK